MDALTKNLHAQLLQAWEINNRVNLMILDNISSEGLNSTLSVRGGRTVALQFVHMHNVRLNWLEHTAKDIFKKYQSLDKTGKLSKTILKSAFQDSGKAIKELIQQSLENGGTLKGFKRGLIPFLGYLMTHDAHHRGNILLTLKQTGVKMDAKVKWQIWEWDKI